MVLTRELHVLHDVLDLVTTEARSRPSTFAPTSIRRDCSSRSIVVGRRRDLDGGDPA
jgi:hypothetical protein